MSWDIGIDADSKTVTIPSYLSIVKRDAGFVEEEIEDNCADNGNDK